MMVHRARLISLECVPPWQTEGDTLCDQRVPLKQLTIVQGHTSCLSCSRAERGVVETDSIRRLRW